IWARRTWLPRPAAWRTWDAILSYTILATMSAGASSPPGGYVPALSTSWRHSGVQPAGICGSDLHQFTGQHSWKVNYPVILGHEFAGIVAKRGSKVRAFSEGD